jgi:Ca2+-binding EF-hand superfamily protein
MKALIALVAILAMVSFTDAQEPKGKGKGKGKPSPEDMFKRKDANSDGKVSKEEFTKGAKDAAKAETAFGKLDKDSSGDLSLEEFKAMGAKKPKA